MNPQDVAFGKLVVEKGLLPVDEVELFSEHLKSGAKYAPSLSKLFLLEKKLTEEQVHEVNEELKKRDLPNKVGEFEILECLGRGGMGVVYKAKRGDEYVALKVISKQEESLGSQVNARRFLREIESVLSVKHPCIVEVLDFGVDIERDAYFVALELVTGINLKQLIAQRSPIPVKKALEIIQQVARGIHYASKENIIHRDIKPENILLGNDGSVKITDFGLAKKLDSDNITQTNIVLGTAYYMAPEIAQGKKDITSAADIYSLGITFFHMLTGVPPFHEGNPAQLMVKHIMEPLPPFTKYGVRIPSKAYAEVENLLKGMTQKSPSERYSPYDVIKHSDKILYELGRSLTQLRMGVAKVDLNAPSLGEETGDIDGDFPTIKTGVPEKEMAESKSGPNPVEKKDPGSKKASDGFQSPGKGLKPQSKELSGSPSSVSIPKFEKDGGTSNTSNKTNLVILLVVLYAILITILAIHFAMK